MAHRRDEQRRVRLVDAAAEFSTGVQQAILRIHDAILAVNRRARRDRRQAAVREAERVIGEAIARVGRISLLFGVETKPDKVAGDVIRQLERTLNHMKGRSAKARVPAAWSAIGEAYALHRTF